MRDSTAQKKRILAHGIFYRMVSFLFPLLFILFPAHRTSALILFFEEPPAITFSSPFLPVGSGARAMGMGGAFIAVADDATAASWNPGGLPQLTLSECSIVGSLFIRHDRYAFAALPEASHSQTTTDTTLNYLSVVTRASMFNRNLIFSLNYQRLYSMDYAFHRTWPYLPGDDPMATTCAIQWDFLQKGGLSAISPALGVEILPDRLTLGVTLNLWPGAIGEWENGWKKDSWMAIQGDYDTHPFQSLFHTKDRYIFSGTNLHLGFLWKLSHDPSIILGGVVKTPFTAEIQHESKVYRRTCFASQATIDYHEETLQETLHIPISYGLGLAIRGTKYTTLSLDIYRTEWGSHAHTTPNGSFSPIADAPIGSTSVRPTHHIRLGFEYEKLTSYGTIPFRFGLFYDPNPSEKNPDDFYGFSLGSGITLSGLSFDCAYQLRYGRNLKTISFQGETDRESVTQHLFYSSVIGYF